jgi:hypothetical protein
MSLSTIFQLYCISFTGDGDWSIWRKPKDYHIRLYRVHLTTGGNHLFWPKPGVNSDFRKCKQFLHQTVAPTVEQVMNEERKDRIIMITTNGTYPWSFVTQIIRNG